MPLSPELKLVGEVAPQTLVHIKQQRTTTLNGYHIPYALGNGVVRQILETRKRRIDHTFGADELALIVDVAQTYGTMLGEKQTKNIDYVIEDRH